MKKCLHLKKTKPHWRRKPALVVTWRDRVAAERAEREHRLAALRMPHSPEVVMMAAGLMRMPGR
jgi:hypothetical protein